MIDGILPHRFSGESEPDGQHSAGQTSELIEQPVGRRDTSQRGGQRGHN